MNDLIGWCCMNCDQNFFLEKNDESNNMLGAINCPYCGTWKHTVMNTIYKPNVTPNVGQVDFAIKCNNCGESVELKDGFIKRKAAIHVYDSGPYTVAIECSKCSNEIVSHID